MSAGARATLSAAGIGRVDETGAAEIAHGSLIISRSGWPVEAPPKPFRWTPSVLAVAEALLCGRRATVGAVQEATGLSTGSATNALRALAELDLLSAEARRGRNAARRVHDPDRLLDEYAARAAAPAVVLTVGVIWRDFAAELCDLRANFETPDAQAPRAYVRQMRIDHPDLDPSALAADAVLAVREFHRGLQPRADRPSRSSRASAA